MTQIEDLERRITAAFERISVATERQSPAPAPEEMLLLQTALEEERLANAQLEERVRAIREKQETQLQQLKMQVADQQAALAALEEEVTRLRTASQQLRDNNDALRKANAAGLADEDLINLGLQATLDLLKTERAVERAEIDGVLSALVPLLDGAVQPPDTLVQPTDTDQQDKDDA